MQCLDCGGEGRVPDRPFGGGTLPPGTTVSCSACKGKGKVRFTKSQFKELLGEIYPDEVAFKVMLKLMTIPTLIECVIIAAFTHNITIPARTKWIIQYQMEQHDKHGRLDLD